MDAQMEQFIEKTDLFKQTLESVINGYSSMVRWQMQTGADSGPDASVPIEEAIEIAKISTQQQCKLVLDQYFRTQPALANFVARAISNEQLMLQQAGSPTPSTSTQFNVSCDKSIQNNVSKRLHFRGNNYILIFFLVFLKQDNANCFE